VVREERRATVRPLQLELDASSWGLCGVAASMRGERHGHGSRTEAAAWGVPAPGGAALLLVRVLVPAERLRLEELLVAEEAREQPRLLPADARRHLDLVLLLLVAVSGRRQA